MLDNGGRELVVKIVQLSTPMTAMSWGTSSPTS